MKIYLFYTTSNLVFPNPPNSIVSGGMLEPIVPDCKNQLF